MPETQPHCQHLAARIQQLLARGLILSDDVQHYCESALGAADPESVTELFQQADDSELASFLELVFFPDQEIKVCLEPELEHQTFQPGDETVIAELLVSALPVIQVYFPDSSKAIPVPLSPTSAENFLTRLRLRHGPPDELLRTIARTCPRQQGLQIQALLRSSRIEFSRPNIQFLQTFLEGFSIEFSRFFDYLDFAIDFVDELGGQTDFKTGLIEKKIHLEQALNKADMLQKQMRSLPMEALLMQRQSILSLNREELLDRLRIVNDLCAVILGYVPETGSEGLSMTFPFQPEANRPDSP
jgi:hypothetical protein